jgi:hypothetical protein
MNMRSTENYCRDHECKDQPCYLKAKPGGRYCVAHGCGISKPSDCLETRSGMGSFYCDSHECKEPECHGEARNPGGYCAQAHACLTSVVVNCAQKRLKSPGEPTLCAIHKCRVLACVAQNKADSGYCRDHACLKHDCGSVPGNNDAGWCVNHYVQHLEMKLEKTKTEKEAELARIEREHNEKPRRERHENEEARKKVFEKQLQEDQFTKRSRYDDVSGEADLSTTVPDNIPQRRNQQMDEMLSKYRVETYRLDTLPPPLSDLAKSPSFQLGLGMAMSNLIFNSRNKHHRRRFSSPSPNISRQPRIDLEPEDIDPLLD